MEKEYKLIPMTFFWMFLGLLGTAIISFYSYQTDLCYSIVQNGFFNVLLITEIVVVILFSLLFKKLSPLVVTILYFVYSMINGITLSTIFYIFELQSIVILFVATALTFALLGIYGYATKNDLTSWKPILITFLIVGAIVSIINLFLENTVLDVILDWVILTIFFAMTVYDINEIKRLASDENIEQDKIHIYCAMQLYLDFINIFIRILSIFGDRKD